MRPKPDHLGPECARQFRDQSVVAAYHYRPPYPATVFDVLVGLVVEPGIVLDDGTGTAELARGLVGRVDAVDAVDPSPGMVAKGRGLPGGDDPSLTWIVGSAEDAPLRARYGLITAGSSLHWLEWEVALPRFRTLLALGGVLAIVEQRELPKPWDGALQEIIDRLSTNRLFRPYDLVAELAERGLFRAAGRQVTAPVAFAQPVVEYVESFHARNGFLRDRMSREAATAFDDALGALVGPFAREGMVRLEIAGEVTWGLPAPG